MKLILIFLFTFLTLLTNAQDRLGNLIIGKTDIEFLEKELGKPEITNDLDFYNIQIFNENEPSFCEIIFNKKCDELKMYYISIYSIKELKIEDVYLFFYKNKLIQIICNKTPELDHYFILKYGKPFKFENTTLKTHSSTMEYDEHITELLWKKGTVKAISYQNTQIFNGIKRDAGSYFILTDTMTQKIIYECDNFSK